MVVSFERGKSANEAQRQYKGKYLTLKKCGKSAMMAPNPNCQCGGFHHLVRIQMVESCNKTVQNAMPKLQDTFHCNEGVKLY